MSRTNSETGSPLILPSDVDSPLLTTTTPLTLATSKAERDKDVPGFSLDDKQVEETSEEVAEADAEAEVDKLSSTGSGELVEAPTEEEGEAAKP